MAYGRRFDEWDRCCALASLLHPSHEPIPNPLAPVPMKTKAGAPKAIPKISVTDLIAALGGKVHRVQ